MSYMKIYSLQNCCDCKALKKFLTENKIEFEDVIVSTKEDMEEVGKITGKTKVYFPVTVLDNDIIYGFNYEFFKQYEN